MADSSWDNGGYGQPSKPGLPTWAKVLLGCGVAAVLAMVTCVGGVAYLAHRVRQNPEGFQRKIMGLAADKIRPDWEDYRKVVEQLRTPEGCKALYEANPGLATTWTSEAEFLEAAKGWQPALVSPPELSPDLLSQGSLQISRVFGGKVRVTWRPKTGPGASVTFEGPRQPGGAGPRRVADVQVN